jgi:NADPH2:quinone reductase
VLAYQLGDYTGPENLTLVTLPDPEAAEGELLVEVEAIGLNFYDELMTRGLYQHRPPPPIVPGSEVAGTVRSAPNGCGFAVGDHVAGFVLQGGFATQVTLPIVAAVHVPDGVSSVTAAAATVNYHTAEFALVRRARLEQAENVLVMGAAGAVGAAAVQVAVRHGASVVAGLRRIPDGQPRMPGVVGSLELSEGFAARIREMLSGQGVDVVFDPVGGWLTEEALRALRPEGRLIVIGFAAGEIPKIRANRLLLNNISVIGAGMGAFLDVDTALLGRQAEVINPWLADGSLQPLVAQVVPFTELPAALSAVGQGMAGGKVVVELGIATAH